MKISDLAEVMVEEHGAGGIKIEEIGAKPGEKIYEELVTEEEQSRTLELEHMLVVLPAMRELRSDWDFSYPDSKPFRSTYRSDLLPVMSRDAVRRMLLSVEKEFGS